MAPFNQYAWNQNQSFDNRQQSDNTPSCSYGSNNNSNSQYGSASTNSYQTGRYPQIPSASNASYSRTYGYQPSNNESRAAETLSALSSQEPAYSAQNNTNTSYSNGSWPSTNPRGSTSMTSSTPTTTTAGDASYGEMNPTSYSSNTNAQTSRFDQINNQGAHRDTTSGYGFARNTGSNYNAGSNGYLRNAATTAASTYNSQTQSSSPRIHQIAQTAASSQIGTSYGASPSTSGASRIQSVTPTQLQQQARNAPPPVQTSSIQTTIDPTQVYDPWPEQQRQAERAAEERRRKEAEQAKRKAEEQAAEKKRKDAADAADRERSQGVEQAKSPAASVLNTAKEGTSTADRMEAEMRAMFQKMRQFNSANPKLLAKLWEEERQAHVTKGSPEVDTTTPEVIEISPDPADAVGVTKSSAGTSSAKKSAIEKPAKAAKTGTNGTPKTAKSKKASSKDTDPAAARPSTSVSESQPPPPNQAKSVPATVSAPATAPVAVPLATTVKAPAPAATIAPATSSSSSTTIWPPGRKQLLAETGAMWLNTRKENAGKHISVQQLVEILNGNPSYPTLCASIEALGLYLDRSAFARTLLTAVPDLNKSTASQPVNAVAPAPAANTVAQTPAPVRNGVVTEAPMVNGVYRPPSATVTPNAEPRRTVVPRAYLNIIETEASRPLTKKEDARKRGYQVMLDLTKDDDDSDNDIPRPVKIQNTGPSPINPSATTGSLLGDLQQQQVQDIRPVPRPHNPVEAKLKGQILVGRIRREKVARKSTYDPRTIARDVLLATGRHPDMRPLNGHLMCMQHVLSEHSDGAEMHKYDLSTIRWDLIDPGDPLPESDDERSDDDASLGDGESDGEISSAARSLPGMRPVEMGDGMMTVTTSFASQQHFLVGKGKRRGRPPRQSAPAGMQSLAGSGGNGGQNRPSTSAQSGTPRGQRDHVNSRSAGGTPGSAPQPRRSGESQGSPSASGGPTGYTALRQQNLQYDENGNPIKRKGRPVGWRKSVHSRAAHGLAPAQGGSSSSSQKPKSNSSTSEMKRRGRAPLGNGKKSPEPHYNEYICQWRNCAASLHNLDTLRKHVHKVHGSWTDIFLCLWGDCGTDHESHAGHPGKAVARGRYEFESRSEWVGHIERNHLQSIARDLGDGPRAGLSDPYDSEASQSYLSDAAGRIITPRATPMPDLAEEEAAQGENLAPILRRGMPRVRGTMSESQREDEVKLQHLEATKLIIGPAFDKSGATLATDARRRGLYDDEDFEDEGSEDDGPPWP